MQTVYEALKESNISHVDVILTEMADLGDIFAIFILAGTFVSNVFVSRGMYKKKECEKLVFHILSFLKGITTTENLSKLQSRSH
ncbi:MAG: hypothetical protein TECD_00044 [Hyphomicrobiaceae bacterium hypho_1]